jgi:putative flippase GtrA
MLDDAPVLEVDGAAEMPLLVNQGLTADDGWTRESPLEWLREAYNQRRRMITKLARYAATSGLALGISEVTLLVVYANGVGNATLAALIGNLAGTVPSYLMSRYWIWRDAQRTRAGRQVFLYWLTAAISMALTSLATGAIARLAPAGHHFHLAVVGIGFPAFQLILWLGKYLVYQHLIFREPATAE